MYEELSDQADEDDEDEDRGVLESLHGDVLARSLLDTQVSNQLNLLKAEVRRLRSKVQALQNEKDDMVDNFRSTTQILLNRIKELESNDAQSRPQTAAVIDRIEARGKHCLPVRGGAPEVLDLDNKEPGGGKESGTSVCGNCGREIPTANLVSHSVFCYRNNYRCPACDEVIAVRDKESHVEQWTDGARLLDAVGRRDAAMIQCMAAHGIDFCSAAHPETQDSVLHAAAGLGDVELISFFMGYGVEVDPINVQGATPLHVAAEQAQLEAVQLLVELGAELNVRNGAGETPLMLVCRKGHAQAAKFLLEMRADAEAGTKLGDTPLQIAQRLGFQETVHALCSAGAPLRPGTPSRARPRSPSPLPPRPKSGESPRPDATGVPGGIVPSGYPPPAPRKGAPPIPSGPSQPRPPRP
ncbi:Rai14 [Symbiodinium sp. CCMP2592]|nr:Rai14 [Symbiodinium sp. CCMP2592]